MDPVTLNTSQQIALQQLRQNSDVRADVTRRLSTGERVSGISDGPQDFLNIRAQTDRIDDLNAARADIGQQLSALATTQVGTAAIENALSTLRGLANSARGQSTETRADLAAQFDRLLPQIDSLAADTSFNGTNGIGDSLSSAGLNLGSAVTDFNSFATDADIDAAVARLDAAVTTVRDTERSLATDISILDIQDRFNRDLANTTAAARDRQNAIDANEEAARLLAVQVREQFAVEQLNFSTRTEGLIADLLSGATA